MNTNTETNSPVTIEYKGKYINNCVGSESNEGFYIVGEPAKNYKSLRAAKMAVTRAETALKALEPVSEPVVDSIATTTEPVVLASPVVAPRAYSDFEQCFILELEDMLHIKLEQEVSLGKDDEGNHIRLQVTDCTKANLGYNIELRVEAYYGASYYSDSGRLVVYKDSIVDEVRASVNNLSEIMKVVYNIPADKVSII